MTANFVRQAKIAALVLSLTSWGWAQGQGTDNGREFHWTAKLAPDQVVVVKNINGEIDATGSSNSDQVEVTAVKSGPGSEDVKIRVVKLNDGVMICPVFSAFLISGDCESSPPFLDNHRHVKVDFTVHLPQNLRFTGKNVNGAVDAESMGRYVEADSVNGAIRISTRSWATANSVNGSIEAKLGRADWPGALEFRTVNGSIKLELPGNLNADVDFITLNGHLESEFPLTVRGAIGTHSVHGTIGNGGRSLDIKTVNGTGELRRAAI